MLLLLWEKKIIFRKAITVTWVENRKDCWITDIQFLRPLRMLGVVSKPALPYLLTHKRKQGKLWEFPGSYDSKIPM